MAEYTELQLKAKEEGIKSWHVKSDEVLADELAAKWATPVPEDENNEVVVSETVKEAPKFIAPAPAAAKPPPPAAAPEGKVTFYWKDKRNVEFTIETRKATPTSLRQAESFASKNSVIVLDPTNPIEKQAIEKLRKDAKFKLDFDEVDNRRNTPGQKGAKLDELMELDTSVLIQMVGGSIADSRKTRGELIQQIMGN
jgi:hypothetical protein